MPYPYFDGIPIDFTGILTFPRKRKAVVSEHAPPELPRLYKKTIVPCPHIVTTVRSTRQLAAEKTQCPICFEDFLSTPAGREKVNPVKLDCDHIFCKECLETHFSSSLTCPLRCQNNLPLQPHDCTLCATWQRDHAAANSLTVTLRADEMLPSIKNALEELALDDDFFRLTKKAKALLFRHIRNTLKRYEWQFHTGTDLAELLDPFLRQIDIDAARAHYGPKLSAPASDASRFPPREHDADDYPPGQEPWIAAFFRQWALGYEQDNGEIRAGWSVWERTQDQDSWDWPLKRIVAHTTNADGQVEYLLKWVGQRYNDTWEKKESVDLATRETYGKAHGLVQGKPKKKRRTL